MNKDYIDIKTCSLSDMFNCPIVRENGIARVIIAKFEGHDIGTPGLYHLPDSLSDFEVYEQTYEFIKRLAQILK